MVYFFNIYFQNACEERDFSDVSYQEHKVQMSVKLKMCALGKARPQVKVFYRRHGFCFSKCKDCEGSRLLPL